MKNFNYGPEELFKKCGVCGEIKSVDDFSKAHKNGAGDYHYGCKDCVKLWASDRDAYNDLRELTHAPVDHSYIFTFAAGDCQI